MEVQEDNLTVIDVLFIILPLLTLFENREVELKLSLTLT